MTELDQVWSQMLSDASVRAGDTGREFVAEYLRLRAGNDAIRRAGVGWLFDEFIAAAAEQQRVHRNIVIEREDPHKFRFGNSYMAGALLHIRQGVRCLMVEAGWARTPSDGIMKKGALAHARIHHFGMPKAGVELGLLFGSDLPAWFEEAEPRTKPFDEASVRSHVHIFLS